jgi:hypothetical protein
MKWLEYKMDDCSYTRLPIVTADILGFKSYIFENSLEKAIGKLLQFTSDSNMIEGFLKKDEGKYKNANFQTIFFSDSMFIYLPTCLLNRTLSDEEMNKKIKVTIMFLSRLIHNSIFSLNTGLLSQNLSKEQLEKKEGLRADIPVRASFSFDEYEAKSIYNQFIITGRGVVTVHQWQEKQKWLGASFDPDTYLFFKNHKQSFVDELLTEKLIVEYTVPTNDGVIPTYAINFNCKDSYKFLCEQLDTHKRRFEKNERTYAKYVATREFLDYCEKSKIRLKT